MNGTRPRVRRALVAAAAAALGSLAAPASARADGLVFQLPGIGVTTFRFTNTTTATFRTNNFDTNPYDDNFLGGLERFDSSFTAAPWRLQVRIDGFYPLMFGTQWPAAEMMPPPPGTECAVTTCYLRGDLRLERLALRYQRGILTAEAGDIYTVLGRGTALSFRKVDPLGIDTTIRGGRLEVDLGRFMIRGFGGAVNPQNFDSITMAIWQDYQTPATGLIRPDYDLVGGGEATARLGPDEDMEFAVHALRVHFPETYLRTYDVDVFGYRMQIPNLFDGALALHFEVNGMRRTTSQYRLAPVDMPNTYGPLSRQSDAFGRGVYGSAQFTSGNWNAVLEWKDYTNFILSPDGSANDLRRVYNAAPPLEREDVQFRSNFNTRGGRLRIEHAFRPSPWSLQMTGVLSGFAEEVNNDPWGDHGIGVAHVHMLLRRRGQQIRTPSASSASSTDSASTRSGAEPTSGSSGMNAVSSAATGGLSGGAGRMSLGQWQFQASLGFRHEFLLGDIRTRTAGTADWQVGHGDIDVAFALTRDDSIEARLDVRVENRWSDTIGTDGGYYTYTRSGLAVTWSHTDQLQVTLSGRIDTLLQSQGNRDAPVFFPAAEARYRFLGGSTIRVFGGMTPGGLLCSGGVCRFVPPFQGALAELILRI